MQNDFRTFSSCRRERDNSEAEKAQHMKQIHDLQEHIKEKESHFLALEEQVSYPFSIIFALYNKNDMHFLVLHGISIRIARCWHSWVYIHFFQLSGISSE